MNDARYDKLRCMIHSMMLSLERFRQIGKNVNMSELDTQSIALHEAYNAVYHATYRTLDCRDCMDITCGMVARAEELLRNDLSRGEIQTMEPAIPAGVLDAVMPIEHMWKGTLFSDYM